MAKRAGGSEAGRPRVSRAARPARARPASEVPRDEVLAAEAADVIAANATKAGPGEADAVHDDIERHIETPDQESGQDERDRHAEDAVAIAEELLVALRVSIVRHGDFNDLPKMRVVGRVIHVLTVSRGWPSCTGGEVFRVFLQEIPDRLPEVYRQARQMAEEVDVTAGNGARAVYRRLERLVDDGYAGTTAVTVDAKNGQYVMTALGRMVFRDWPTDVHLSLETRPRPSTRRPPVNRVTTRGPRPNSPHSPNRTS